jgi:hypothetical protein
MMRRLLAFLLAVSLATPALAVDGWNTLSMSANGPTWTDIHCEKLTTSKVVCVNRAATSKTNAVKLLDLSTNPVTITTFDAPNPATANFGKIRGIGGNSTTIRISGGGRASANFGNWIAHSSISAPSTWTLDRDTTASPFYATFGGQLPDFGSREFGAAYTINAAADAQGTIYTATASPLGFTGPSVWAAGFLAFYDEVAGVKVTSSFYYGARAGNSHIYADGYSGSGTSFLFSSDGINACDVGPATATGLIRPAFTDGTAGYTVSYDTSSGSSHLCGHTSSSFQQLRETKTSVDLRPGVYFTFPSGSARLYVWSTAGVAWVSNGASPTSFANESGTTHDVTCDSGTVTQVIAGVDVDNDADSTDNVLAFCSSGNAQYWGSPIAAAASSGYSAPKRSRIGPFNALPFRGP